MKKDPTKNNYLTEKKKTKQNKIGRKLSMVGKKIFSFPDIANG